ncbi:MAG: hypothetical protein J6U94_00815, partial [Paludibacteraceae bacterium]|nr:hypothetical protein [Paludibacteraceae bacterium]
MKTNFTHTMLTWIGAAIISTACAWGVTHYYSLQPTTDTPDNTQPDYVRPAVNTPRMADTDFTTAAQLSVNAVVHVKTTYTAQLVGT